MSARAWWTDAEIDAYLEATKDLARAESLEDLRARLIRQRDAGEFPDGPLRCDEIPKPLPPRSHSQTRPGSTTMVFTTLRVKD